MPLTATPGQETAAPARRPHGGFLSTCTLRHASDDGLVALTRAGSERAFAEIMRRYQRPLQFYCLHLVGAPRAEDAVQQAFMQAFISLRDGPRRDIALRPWLYRITRNCAIDLLRKQPFDHDELDPDFDGLPQTPGVFEQKEELARIVAAIQALPEGQRRALTLRELEGRSYGEISAELGHTDSGVRQLIFRARTALRNLGALIFPLDSIRWRLLGSSSTSGIADPHQVAAAATVSSTGGGNVLQAAASAVAATVTLLAAGAPHERHGTHAATQPVSAGRAARQAPSTSTPFGGPGALTRTRRRVRHEPGRNSTDVGGPATALSPGLASAPVALTAPVMPAAEPGPTLPVDPPSVLAMTDATGSQAPVTPAALGGPGSASDAAPVSATSTASDRTAPGGMGAAGTSGDSRQPTTATTNVPGTRPPGTVVPPVKTEAPSKVGKPSQPKPAAAPKATTPNPPALKKPAAPKPAAPKVAAPKVAAPKVPASPLKAFTTSV